MAGEDPWGPAAGGGFAADWDARSYTIARRLQARGEWESYVTAQELVWVTRALESPELWRQFISPRPEQWRLRALPSAAFEAPSALLEAPHANGQKAGSPAAAAAAASAVAASAVAPAIASAPAAAAAQLPPQPSEVRDGKRTAPDSDSDANSADKRARTAAALAFESDDDVLSVLSGSDIDMGMWAAGGSSVVSNAVSPEPGNVGASDTTAGTATAGAAAAAAAAAAAGDATAPHTADLDAVERSLVCAAAAFHARAAIFEHYAAVLCDPGECSACTDLPAIRADVQCAESALRRPETSAGPDRVPSMPAPLQSRTIDEDDNYDESDDGDADGGPRQNGEHAGDGNGVAGQLERLERLELLDRPEGAERCVVVREVFHTLDELEDAAHEHSEHVAQMEQIRAVAEQRAAEPRDMLASKIGALQNMKNLAQFIDQHRDSVSMSTRELSSLLSEVRPRRSKWANERRVGQVELYEALEHVLNELRAMGEAAQPFLNQVKRKDAPDYYKVIKRPMDLGTMAKHLRNEAYNSKRQFADHLQLIRDNCYTYNTEPDNYYRRSADALLARATRLMDAVPDIVVHDRAAGADGDECGDESGSESQRVGYGVHREGSVAVDDGTPAPGEYGSVAPDEQSLGEAGAAEGAAPGSLPAPGPPSGPVPGPSALTQTVMRVAAGGLSRSAIAAVADGYERSLAERVWRARARQQLWAWMEQLGDSGEFGSRQAVLRTGAATREFLDSAHEARERIGADDVAAAERLGDTAGLCTVYAQGGAQAAEARRQNEALDTRRSEWLALALAAGQRRVLVGECAVGAGASQPEPLDAQARRRGVAEWLLGDGDGDDDNGNGNDDDAAPSIEAYAAARFPDGPTWRAMADNLERLRSIREVDDKIWAKRLNIPAGYLRPEMEERAPAAAAAPAVRVAVRDIHGDYVHRPDPPQPLELGAAAARQVLQRTAAFMLAHTGFDAVSASAMACLADFLIDYISNLGRTLRCYRDAHARTMSPEAIVAHSLYANGIDDLAELEYYVSGEISRYGTKLADLHRKLVRSYESAASDDPARPVGDAEVDDAFVAGMAGGLAELGDDFFGFKELGLDKELGVAHLAVPQRLWAERPAGGGAAGAAAPEESDLPHAGPAPWPPVTGPDGHIGLLHPFIAEKLQEDQGQIPEDEALAPKQRYGAARPRNPPPNCLTHPRTHAHVGSGQPPVAVERAGKKRPAKSTKKKPAAAAAAG
ncbi:Transcriptional activator spt7 [Coemansia javaensis]|uniref:Transcriptional activator spt7 n=1 Tax=Coemansia javaensis TaxID=2761396 RepID=A0A9W8LJC6_9FUNG|nr:Transcriptional activator spt7 [Coemansia javaensis]